MMKSKWGWLRQRPRKEKNMMLIYKKLQIVELRTVINTAKVFAPLKKCNQQKK